MHIVHQNRQDITDMSISIRLNDEQVDRLTQQYGGEVLGYDNVVIRHIDERTVKNLWEKTFEYDGYDRYIGVILRVLYVLANLVTAGIFASIDHAVQAIRREIIYNDRRFEFDRGTYTPNQAPNFDNTRRLQIRRTLDYLDDQGFLNRINERYPNPMPELDQWIAARAAERGQEQQRDQGISGRIAALRLATADLTDEVLREARATRTGAQSEARTELEEALRAARTTTEGLTSEELEGVVANSLAEAEEALREEARATRVERRTIRTETLAEQRAILAGEQAPRVAEMQAEDQAAHETLIEEMQVEGQFILSQGLEGMRTDMRTDTRATIEGAQEDLAHLLEAAQAASTQQNTIDPNSPTG